MVSDIDSRSDINYAVSAITFTCLSDNDAELKRPSLERAPEIIIENK